MTSRNLTGKPLVPRPKWPTRPYAYKKNVPPSVTTILRAMGKGDGLLWGASKETALFAVFHTDEWADLAPAAAVDRLRSHFRGVWDGRAAMGTLVHAVNEAWSFGEDVDVRQVVDDILAGKRPPQIWRGREDDVVAESAGYLDGLEKFWMDFDPRTLATEEVVRFTSIGKSYEYLGQRDWVAEVGGRRLLIDIKTTARQSESDDPGDGVYFNEHCLQLAAYRFADELVLYDDKGKESGSAPNYPVDACCVLHLRGDGRYSLFEVDAGPEQHTLFLKLIDVDRWLRACEKAAPATLRIPETLADQLAASIEAKEMVA